MLITQTLNATPAHSRRVRLTMTNMSEKHTITKMPRMNVGTANASEGPTRSAISRLMLRPASESPRSPFKSGAER